MNTKESASARKWSHSETSDIPRESGGMSILNNFINAVYARVSNRTGPSDDGLLVDRCERTVH